jgi:flagellar basal-body rod protein FlgC
MSSILSIAASGLAAASQRLQISAENVANANSDGPLPSATPAVQEQNPQTQNPQVQYPQVQYPQVQYPQAYVAQQVNQVASPGGGTSAVVSNAQPGTVTAYDPTAPYADQNGQVAAPNVDITNEAVQQAIASYEFLANADVVSVYSKMMQALIDIQT